MIESEILKAIQLIALNDVDLDTTEQYYKHICRWYSRQFHTPLPQVMEMAAEEVFRTFFEDSLYNLKHGDMEKAAEVWAELKAKSIVTQEEVEEVEEEDDSWANEMIEKIRVEEEAKARKKKNEGPTPRKDTKTSSKRASAPNLIEEDDSFEMVGEDFSAIPDDPG